LAAQEREKKKAEDAGGMIGISDCDLGASPQMSKGSISNFKKNPPGKRSPLGVQARQFQQNLQ
jgi:hypothetical protein